MPVSSSLAPSPLPHHSGSCEQRALFFHHPDDGPSACPSTQHLLPTSAGSKLPAPPNPVWEVPFPSCATCRQGVYGLGVNMSRAMGPPVARLSVDYHALSSSSLAAANGQAELGMEGRSRDLWSFLLPTSKGPCNVLLECRTSTCQEDRKAKGGQYLPHLTWGLKIWLKTKVLSARHK